MHPSFRNLARPIVAAGALISVATCSDFTGPYSGPGTRISIAPVFSASANFAKALYSAAGIDYDHVRVVIVRAPAEVLKDTTVAFTPGQAELTLPLVVAAGAGEDVTVTLEYRAADLILYSGTSTATTQPVRSSGGAAPTPIVLVPVGPGASAATVDISPLSGVFPTSQPVTFTAHAFSSSNAVIANPIFGWTVSDPTIAAVSNQGVVTPTAKGGTVKVRATTLNEKFAEATVTFITPPASLAVQSGANQTAMAGNALGAPVVVKVLDLNGNAVPGATVNFAVSTGGGSVAVVNGTSNASGLASVNWTLGDVVGTQSITATASALPNAPLTINATATERPAVALEFVQQPTNVLMNAAIQPSVTVRAIDDRGHTVAGFTGAVAVGLDANPSSATLGGTRSVSAAAGIATFSTLSVSAGGNGFTLKATATGLTAATSASFNVAQVVSALSLTSGGGQTATYHSTLSPIVVKVADANGIGVPNVTVAFTVATGGGSVAVNGVSDAAGLVSASWTLGDDIGTQSITATAAALPNAPLSITATATERPVVALAFVQQPSNSLMNAAIQPAIVVKAIDDKGRTVAGFTGAVATTLAANPGTATLGGTTTVTAVNGLATFSNVIVSAAGTGYTLRFSTTGLASITSSTFNVGQTPSGLSLVSGGSQTATIRTTLAQTVVKVADANGFGVPNVAVTFAVASGGGSIAVDNGTTDANGLARVTWTLGSTIGSQSITATVAGLTGSPLTITATATPLPAVALAFVSQPANTPMNAAISPAVSVRAIDADGNTVTGFAGPITIGFGANPASAILGGSKTAAAVSGVATFNDLAVSAAGNGYTFTATSSGLTGATSSAFNVTQVAATLSLISGGSQAAVIRSTLSPIAVKVADANGVGVPNVTVNFAVATGGGSIVVTNGVTDAAGFARVTWTLGNTVGSQSITASVTGLAGSPLTVGAEGQPLPAVALAFQQQPSNVVVNTTMTPAVTVKAIDVDGNIVSSFNGTIVLTLENNPNSATLAGTTTIGAVNGVATFSNLAVNLAGSGFALKAVSSGLSDATSSTFVVAPPPAAAVEFQIHPSNVLAGAVITSPVEVRIVDANHNIVPGATNAVTVALTPSVGGLGGTVTVNAVNGVATFSDLRVAHQGNGYTLSAASSGLTGATSNAFNVAAAATSLVFYTQPQNANEGATLSSIQVKVLDDAGNLFTGATGQITIALNPSSGDLGGTLLATPSGGIATFANLTVAHAATGYTLVASYPGVPNATSSTFDISTPPPSVTRTWTGAVSEKWSEAGNWNPAVIPVAGDSAIVPSGATNAPVIDNGAFAASLVIEAGASLTITGSETIAQVEKVLNRGTLRLRGGAFIGAVENRAILCVEASGLVNQLLNTATGTVKISSNATLDEDAVLVTTSFTNAGHVELTDVGGLTSEIVVGDSLVNSAGATILVSAGDGGQRAIGGVLRNHGTLTIATTNTFTLAMTGTGSVNDGTISTTAGGNVTQSFPDSTSTFVNTGTMSFSGMWSVLYGKLTLRAGSVTGTGSLIAFQTQLDIDFAHFSIPILLGNGVRFAGAGLSVPASRTAVVAGEFAQPVNVLGTLRVPDFGEGQSLLGDVSIGAGATMETQTDFRISGNLVNNPGGILRIMSINRDMTASLDKPFSNDGTIELSSGGEGSTVTTLCIAEGGTLLNKSTGAIVAARGSGGERRLLAVLENHGTVNVDPGTWLTLRRDGVVHKNYGSINLFSDETNGESSPYLHSFNFEKIEVASTLDNRGSINIGDHRAFYVADGNTLLNNSDHETYFGLVTGNGMLRAPRATFTNLGKVAPGDVGKIGTLTYEGDWDAGSDGIVTIELLDAEKSDRLVINGAATFAEALEVSFIGTGGQPNGNWDIVQYASLASERLFGTVSLPPGPCWYTNYGSTALTVSHNPCLSP